MYTIDRVFCRSRKTIKIPYPTAAHHLQIPLTFPMQEEPKEQSNLHQWIFYYVKWWNVIDSNDARLSANKLSMNIKLNELLNVILIPTVQNANATFAQQSFIPYTHTYTHTHFGCKVFVCFVPVSNLIKYYISYSGETRRHFAGLQTLADPETMNANWWYIFYIMFIYGQNDNKLKVSTAWATLHITKCQMELWFRGVGFSDIVTDLLACISAAGRYCWKRCANKCYAVNFLPT